MKTEVLVKRLEKILSIHSPSGYTLEINKYLEDLFKSEGLDYLRTNKGSLLVKFSDNPKLIVTAHIDTLGAMVKQLKTDGTIEITKIGGYPLNIIEGEYVTVRNSEGKLFRGTFLLNNPAVHVNKDLGSVKRETENMSIRLDEVVNDEKDLQKLGIEAGNFVFFDNRFEHTSSGFIKSRFLDDKACAAVMIEYILSNKENLRNKPVGFYFSNYEEVGHGSCIGIPDSAEELLVLDMAVVGEGCSGSEDKVSVCPKDSSGPYDFEVTTKLIELAKKSSLDYVVDIYPYYGSDGSAALSSGYDVRVGLIGPGVSASHGLERTHEKGLINTYKLTELYINNFLNSQVK